MPTPPDMDAMARDFFARHPEVKLAALGAKENARSMDLSPFGVPMHYYAAERHPQLVERYRDANALAFPGDLTLPGWVLSDLYLLPSAVGLLTCPGRFIDVPTRKRLGLHPDDLWPWLRPTSALPRSAPGPSSAFPCSRWCHASWPAPG